MAQIPSEAIQLHLRFAASHIEADILDRTLLEYCVFALHPSENRAFILVSRSWHSAYEGLEIIRPVPSFTVQSYQAAESVQAVWADQFRRWRTRSVHHQAIAFNAWLVRTEEHDRLRREARRRLALR